MVKVQSKWLLKNSRSGVTRCNDAGTKWFCGLRKNPEFSNVPIIMVTAKGEEQDRVKGLDVGADDYIVKPFSATELLARVRAVLRRAQVSGNTFQQATFNHGNLKIDLARAEVFKDDKMVFYLPPNTGCSFNLFTTLEVS